VHEEDVLRVHGGVRLEGTMPVALSVLLATKVFLRARDRVVDLGEELIATRARNRA
jgi:hypothetical protein